MHLETGYKKNLGITGDSVEAYYNDTMKGGDNIGDPLNSFI